MNQWILTEENEQGKSWGGWEKWKEKHPHYVTLFILSEVPEIWKSAKKEEMGTQKIRIFI